MPVPTDPFHVFIPGSLSDHAHAVLTAALDPAIVLGLDDPGRTRGVIVFWSAVGPSENSLRPTRICKP